MGLRSWAHHNRHLITFVGVAVAVLGVGMPLIWTLFRTPDLSIAYGTARLRMPYSLYRNINTALTEDTSGYGVSSVTSFREVRDFLRDTESFTTITLTNNSSTSLDNVTLRIRFVRRLTGWGIDGDALDFAERDTLLKLITFDKSHSLVTLRSIDRMPPKSRISVYLWGDISTSSFLGPDNVTAAYDGGAGEVVWATVVSGFDAFIYKNAGFLVVLVLVGNLGLWTMICRRAQRATPQPMATDGPHQ